MIYAAHFLLYSHDPKKDRAFFQKTLGFASVDAGEGWLILGLPPCEMGVHPIEAIPDSADAVHRMVDVHLYLLCDDLEATLTELKRKKVPCTPPGDMDWGILSIITMPSGGQIGLYEPRHPLAVKSPKKPAAAKKAAVAKKPAAKKPAAKKAVVKTPAAKKAVAKKTR